MHSREVIQIDVWSFESSSDQDRLATLGFSSGKRMVLFRGAGECEPVGVTAPERPTVGVAPSGESRSVSLTIVLPSRRGFEGSEMFLLVMSFAGAETFLVC
jgi:hypothetical protein